MGTYTTRHGDTPGALAKKYLGDARRWKELWPGDPTKMPTGFAIHVPQGPGGKGQVGQGAPGGAAEQKPTAAQNKAFADLPGPERAQIQAITSEFMNFLGYPSNINENMLMILIQQAGLQNQPDLAFQKLFDALPANLQKASPWARFGLDEVTYMNTRGKLIAAWNDLTGESMGDSVMAQAIGEHWSETQLEQYARSQPDLVAKEPWISAGQSHVQVQEAFIASYGHAPQDDKVLAAWFKFSTQSKQVAASAGQKTTATQQDQARQKDTEVR